jgi:tRNA-Thr(GGU) m(6)t(6)A37 methyltransferase TsaA
MRAPHDPSEADDLTFVVRPIGVARTPFGEKRQAPRQPAATRDEPCRIELRTGLEHAVEDLAGFSRIWVLTWFHEAGAHLTARTKVLPPRSGVRRGVLATRSPHRPNPIGLSAVPLERVEGLVLHVRGLDALDGTPVLDVKPYLPYADAFPDESSGWLARPTDPVPPAAVSFAELALAQFAFLSERGVNLKGAVVDALALGIDPKPYRRIRLLASGRRELALKAWRIEFEAASGEARVELVRSGTRPRELALGTDPSLALHRAFVEAFGA